MVPNIRAFYFTYTMFWLSLWALCAVCAGDDFYYNLKKLWAREARSLHSDLTYTTFPALKNRQIEAAQATESRYPWIARIIHSTTEVLPHVCTASCVDKRLFVTAARCIFNLKVEFMTIYYHNQSLRIRAFVIPSKPTKQMFDDVAIIVVEDEPHFSDWVTIKIFDRVKRTDDEFLWLQALGWEKGPQEHYVVGYAADKELLYQNHDTIYNLTELKIIIDMELCNKITSFDEESTNFWVPCYHSCSVDDHYDEKSTCEPYHGVEGGAVFDRKNNTLLGVATWGGYCADGAFNLPVGFSVLNSDSFLEDHKCALRIRDNKRLESSISYQTLCDR